MAHSVTHATSADGTFSAAGATAWDENHAVTIDADAIDDSATTNKFTTAAEITKLANAREVLTANRNYYVRTDGSNSNDGLTNTSGGAFLTVQKAMDTIAGLDLGTYDAYINIADGTYTTPITLRNIVGAGTVYIVGNTSTPANVIISTTSSDAVASYGVTGRYNLSGFKIQTTTSGSGISILGAGMFMSVGLLNFGACATHHVFCRANAFFEVIGNYTISGGAANHWITSLQGTVSHATDGTAVTITLSGTPAFSSNFASATAYSTISCAASVVTFSGGATGKRYTGQELSLIRTIGGGANYFPGNSAGSVATGAVYT